MKNLFILFVFMSFTIFLNAQTEDLPEVDLTAKEYTSSLAITVHFKDIEGLKQFKESQLLEGGLLKKITIKPNLIFAYTLGEPIQTTNGKKDSYGLKVEIKDQNSEEEFVKELIDSIDGVIALYADGYLTK